jgi:hypothetical protein
MNVKFEFKILKDDVILPLFTEELRNHLKMKINEQQAEAKARMKSDGWGLTKFGEPNSEFYGDYTHHFYRHFFDLLDFRGDWEVYEHARMSGRLHMRTSAVDKDGMFSIYPLNSAMASNHVYDYFVGFKLSIDNYGIDFYKMGFNL